MVKLIDLLKELDLEPGHASDSRSEDMAYSAISKLLSGNATRKYDVFDDKSNSLVEPLMKDILSKYTPILKNGDYYLLFKPTDKSSFQGYFFLINSKADKVSNAFVATMTIRESKKQEYSTANAFDLKSVGVTWSEVGKEYRGKGFGKMMYKAIYEYVTSKGMALASDNTLYKASFGMWVSFMPSIAKYFGIILEGIILPVSKEDVSKQSIHNDIDIDHIIAMENPPPLVRKIANNVKGLSFSKGEYGVMDIKDISINSKLSSGNKNRFTIMESTEDSSTFEDLVDECDSLKELNSKLLKITGSYVLSIGNQKNLKCLVYAFKDAMVIVKEVGDTLQTVIV